MIGMMNVIAYLSLSVFLCVLGAPKEHFRRPRRAFWLRTSERPDGDAKLDGREEWEWESQFRFGFARAGPMEVDGRIAIHASFSVWERAFISKKQIPRL